MTCHPPDGPHLRADQVVLCSGRLAIAGRRLAVGSSSSGQLAVSSSGRFAVSSGGRFAVRSSGRCGAELVAVVQRRRLELEAAPCVHQTLVPDY